MIWKDLQGRQLSDKSKMQNSMYDLIHFVFFREKKTGEKDNLHWCIYAKKKKKKTLRLGVVAHKCNPKVRESPSLAHMLGFLCRCFSSFAPKNIRICLPLTLSPLTLCNF